MKKEPLTLQEKQSVYLNILKELDSFCTAHGIRYYIGCGTLIGAVRHRGFIPWDDDLDIFMPRPDFLRFCNNYKSDRFRMKTIWNDMSHPYTFGSFCDGFYYTIKNGKKSFDCGIDVYVIHGAPSDRKEQVLHMNAVFKYIHKKSRLQRVRDGLARRNLWPGRTLNFVLLNNVLKRADKEFAKFDFENCDYIWPYGGGRLILKKELYGSPIRLQFEDGLFYAPENYHEVLTAGYGNYMELPPEADRHPYHGCVIYRLNEE